MNRPVSSVSAALREVIAEQAAASDTAAAGAVASPQRLRLLSYNIQTGIATTRYRHYLTHSWKHVLPHPERVQNLNAIARLLGDFDIVGLQETDAGSLRSGFVNLTQYLGVQAHFPYWYDQTNRNLGKIAQHSNGLLTRFSPTAVFEHRLPGMIPGRGALIARFGRGRHSLTVMIMHLALSRRARVQQLGYVREVISECPHVILMGDLNCHADSREMHAFLRGTGLREPSEGLPTYPSWRPSRTLDHILVSPTLDVEATQVLDHCYSDHLPISMEVVLPPDVRLTEKPEGRQLLPRRRRLPAPAWLATSAVVAGLFSR